MADANCVAMVIIFPSKTDFPGITNYTAASSIKTKNTFPVFEITQKQNDSLSGWFQNQTLGVHVRFSFSEPNPWNKVFTYFAPIFGNLLLIFTGVILVIGFYKYLILLIEKGFQLSIAQMVLVLNLLCLLIRAVWLCSNPFGAYRTTLLLWVQFGMTFPFALSFCGIILLVLYWHEMIARTGPQINQFVSRMLGPFLFCCGLVLGVEIATSVARGLGVVIPILTAINAAIYAILALSLLIFFIVTKIRLSKEFERLNKKLNAQKGKRLTLASNIIIGIGIVMVCWIIALIILAAGPFFWTPLGFMIIWIVLLVGMNVMCLLQILLIRAPYRSWRWIWCGFCTEDPSKYMSTHQATFTMSSAGSSSSAAP